jgi:hypothetical protein
MSEAIEPVKKASSLRDAGLENYDVVEMNRRDLKGAAYNPRVLKEAARQQLRIALKRHGMVAPPVWNKRTGTLVSGHQRMAQLDSIQGSSDYTLKVAVIDVDEAREKELNLLLNNDQAMGEWDWERLRTMFDDEAVTLEGAGFSHTDMVNYFGTDVFDNRREDLAAFAQKMASVASQYDSITKANADKAANEFFLVFVFKTPDEVERFQKTFELPQLRYQNGHVLMRLLGMPIADDAPPVRRSAGTRKKAAADSSPPAQSDSASG